MIMQLLKETFEVEKEVKHSIRYASVNANKVLDSAYVKKLGLPSPAPKTLTITIECED
jgi:hypothetical protein